MKAPGSIIIKFDQTIKTIENWRIGLIISFEEYLVDSSPPDNVLIMDVCGANYTIDYCALY